VRRRRPALALAYHGVSDVPLSADPLRLFVSPRQLRRDLRLLRRWGYELVTFGELATRVARNEASGSVALTFDDGIADNLTTAAPLLLDAGAPATFFIVTGWFGKCHPDAPWAGILTETDVDELSRLGFEIGVHTVNHLDLTTLHYEAVCAELGDCRATLESLLGRPVRVAAYPYGAADERVRQACRRVGIEAACRAAGGGTWLDSLDLPREAVGNRTSRLGLRLKRDGRYETLMKLPGVRRVGRARRRLHSAVREAALR
jgi:peptidoglycan/xylan/chitin deacetylase (PgdA/CDA1 family)